MLPQQYCLRWKYHHSNLQTMFSQLLDRGCFCDVTLACEGQLIRAHRVVLCACSTFFDTVLTNYASERDPIIIMKDVTFADVKCLIEFMYKGEINVEHAHLASLLKTADDLKIKGLAEVSWREDEDGPPPPIPAAEYHSPARTLDTAYAHEHEQQQQRITSPEDTEERERKSTSPAPLKLPTRMPTLTPIQSIPTSISIAASSLTDHYLGPKRKRGRPPLDDAYDVFNIRKMSHLAAHLDPHQGYLETHHYNEEQRSHSSATEMSPSSSTAAAVAYQQHIHQQQSKQRLRHRQRFSESEETEHDEVQADPEWITSNLEVNVAECEQTNGSVTGNKRDKKNSESETEVKEKKLESENPEILPRTKIERRKHDDRTPDRQEKSAKNRIIRKNSNERHEYADKEKRREPEIEDMSLKRTKGEINDEELESTTVPQPVEEIESVQQVLEHQLPASTTCTTSAVSSPISASASTSSNSTSPSTSTTSSSLTHKQVVHSHVHTNATPASAPPPPPPTSLHHPSFGKYVPEGYLVNEHGILMTHDFVHAATATIPSASLANAPSVVAASNGGNEHDFVDIKMEDYDAADLRLTTEEMSQWQDVIKMDDYLAKGRRPQFWEEPFTRRVLDAIKNKRLEMKKAARILGVSYGTLYGRYREVYGCLKHPYSSTTFRPSQSSQLGIQPRFDIVWPSTKRDGGLLSGHLEIGKIRPKDLSELWARPQI